jgi:phage terminase large subunit GpA-like protein
MTEIQLLALEEILDGTLVTKTNVKPSDWYEKNMRTPTGNALPKISYANTPYWKDVVDCFDPDHPARDISIMGPAQMGKSVMVLNPAVGYTIAENPGNILFLTGHTDLTKDAVIRIDSMIEACGLSRFIKSNNVKAKNNRSGDTYLRKEFRGRTFIAGSITNHNLMRQNDVMIAIADDLDAGKKSKGDTGSTIDLIKGRTKAYEHKCKRAWVSSPQIQGQSLIEIQIEKSDKRFWNVQCPCCHKPIVLDFMIQVDDKNTAGIVYKLDNFGRVDPKTVGYVCQLCAGFFTDQNKTELLNSGLWVPTCTPKEHYHYGFCINGLYAAPGMTSWFTLASKYVLTNPEGESRRESEYQTFLNIDMGQLYTLPKEELKATQLLRNIRAYDAGTVPENLSIKDGNGEIVMLTCAIDLNGVYNKAGRQDDVRLDYEVVAWSASGATYSILHGSIGTFIFRESESQKKIPREKWTYDRNKENNVWREVDRLLATEFVSDSGKIFKIVITAMDTGYCENQAFEYIDTSNFWIVGVKGNPENKYKPMDRETKNFKIGQSRSNLYILDGHNIKDDLAACMRLRWDSNNGESQPFTSSCAGGFMNYPQHKSLYQYVNFFCHYEAEARVEDYNDKGEIVGFVWKKKDNLVQNHFWDCRYYNIGAKEIFLHLFFAELKVKNYTWRDYVKLVLGN